MAYVDDLAAYPDKVTVNCSDTDGRAALDRWRPDDPRVRVYACGTARLLDDVSAWGAVTGGFPPKIERFVAATADAGRPRAAFEVRAARSDVTTTVAPHETIVAAPRRAGVEVITSCAQGVCGTCETEVLEGEPDHRDSLLDDSEREIARCLFPCVSRSRSERLVLDL
ncbi:2Fe-2S iron-sulfur cluster-binding protein [Nostocoides australiense]|nr:iron-sulfur cluster-binding domain-containing protein [Tetrasphaera australiensis]